MKATPIAPKGIPIGHVGPLYPAYGQLSTYNHGVGSRTEYAEKRSRPMRGLLDYVKTKEDKQ